MVSNYDVIHEVSIQLHEGSKNKQLNWRFSLSEQLLLVQLELAGSGVVANIVPLSGEVTVSKAFTSRVNVSWVTGHVTLNIFKVTTSDKGVFSCQLSVPGNSWKSNIEVAVLGNLLFYFVYFFFV